MSVRVLMMSGRCGGAVVEERANEAKPHLALCINKGSAHEPQVTHARQAFTSN